DGTVRLWKASGSGAPVIVGAHPGGARSAVFSPDGTRVVSVGADGMVRIWSDLEPIEPNAPRLWRATSYCIPPEQREELLGLSASMARAHYDGCLRRVAEANVQK